MFLDGAHISNIPNKPVAFAYQSAEGTTGQTWVGTLAPKHNAG